MIFRKLFRRKRSSKIAKERLEILLVTDRIDVTHTQLSP